MKNILAESSQLVLVHEYENAYLIEKSTQKVLLYDDFYGNPEVGLIDKNNNWAIVAGEHLTIWTKEKIIIYNNNVIQWIDKIRLKNNETIEILTDPWSDKSTIWELNLTSFNLTKIKDFKKYQGKPFCEDVEW